VSQGFFSQVKEIIFRSNGSIQTMSQTPFAAQATRKPSCISPRIALPSTSSIPITSLLNMPVPTMHN